MAMLENPFILEPYRSKAFFCDREKETEEIIRNIKNGRNTTLISPRRLGKTGLIFRTDNPEKAAEVITSHGLNIIKEKDLSLLV